MQKMIVTAAAMGALAAVAGRAQADQRPLLDYCLAPQYQPSVKNPNPTGGPVLILDPAHHVAVTHFLFLQSKEDKLSDEYIGTLRLYVQALASQPGFIASMTLEDIDLLRAAVYYQFSGQNQYDAAQNNSTVQTFAQRLRGLSSQFRDYAATPHETASRTGAAPAGYRAEFRVCESVGINEAVVVSGRTQAELTKLMHTAFKAFNPGKTDGFEDNTFHTADDGSRNMNLLHYTDIRHSTVAGLNTFVQGLINGGLTGGFYGWGPEGPGYIGYHVYGIVQVQNANR